MMGLQVNPYVPLVTKTEFLLTLLVQYQADSNENKEKFQLGDY